MRRPKCAGRDEGRLCGGRRVHTRPRYHAEGRQNSQNFIGLQEELTSTENKIGFARQHFNDSVMQYNNRTEVFPSNVVAGMFSFKQESFFEIEDKADREVPQVKF